MKHPSTVGRDNLRSFYTKTKFPEDDAIIAGKAKEDGNERVRKALEQFGYAFLRAHKGLVFGEVREQQQSRNSAVPPATTADATTSVTVALSVLVESVLGAPSPPDPDAVGASIAKDLLRMTITKAIAILIATVWDLGERAKDTKAPTATRHHLRTSQSQTITLAFDLLAPFDLPAPTAPATASNCILLQPLSIWCSFLAHNHDLLAQIYALARRSEPAVEPRHSSAYTSGRGREVEADAARDVLTRLMALMRGLAARFGEEARAHSGSTPVVDERIAMWPVPEDGELLGMMPLRKFHAGIDLLREADERDGEEGAGDERRVRVARVWMCLKRFAELETFDFIQYNEAENKFIVIDEETKKQQRTRMMRVLATQRLKEQVTSLEQDLSQLAVSPPTSPNRRDRRTSVVLSSGATLPKRQRRESKNRHGGPTIPLRIVTVVVDVSVLMDALPLVKRWAGIGGGLDAAVGGGGVLCEVIVPLDVIDSLDFHKKGMTTTNVHAREAIRFLDQRFRPHNDHANSAPASLNHDGQPASSLAIVGLVSSFLRAQRVSERLEKWEDVAPLWVGPLSYRADKDEGDAAEAVENEEAQPTEMDVPKRFRPVIGCALHYYQNQRRAGVAAAVGTGAGGVQQKAVDVVLVTNDKAMAWWAVWRRLMVVRRAGTIPSLKQSQAYTSPPILPSNQSPHTMLRPRVLSQVLQQSTSGGIKASLLMNNEGSILASSADNDRDARVYAAISANIWATYDKNCSRPGFMGESGEEGLRMVLVECEEGTIAITTVSTMLLCLVAADNVGLGIIIAKANALMRHLEEPLQRVAEYAQA
ncbi:hypothetical protein BC938DRAFT_473542 [Jimgerdemannia flammicorona]|uniref:Roadblock/LAMTOR2 domain-containing protein n=1 Tax=Jimgerdemannia flammicorona TaxID=994334 RepID=A0A433Q401_9FUNG|nr:hypothetical protein BC938DRAFT_473542 [Jimgerdemannia flammicorona]